MHLHTFTYTQRSQWSIDSFPAVDSDQTAVFIFGAPEFRDNPAPIEKLIQAYPTSHIVGCSSSGEIFGDMVFDMSLSVAVIQFEKTTIKSACAACTSAEDSFQAGVKIAEDLNQPNLRGVFVLSDGLQVNGSELIKGINSVLSQDVIVTGGLAGDGDRFENTWVIEAGRVQSGFIHALGFYGDYIELGHGSKGGWDTFGPERIVTRSEANILYELDNKPALELYKRYLGDQAEKLPASALLFPLALRENSKDDKSIVRTILSIDEEKQAMIFAGDIPQGYLAKLMKANFERLIDGAESAAKLATRTSDPKQTLCIAISCVGRRLVLGERADEELEATMEILPSDTQQVGFYSYGEISPYATGYCDLHNQTMTLTTISEKV